MQINASVYLKKPIYSTDCVAYPFESKEILSNKTIWSANSLPWRFSFLVKQALFTAKNLYNLILFI